MTIKDKLNKDNLPRHIAIIMDGSGRWAKKRGKTRIFGHKNAVVAVRNVVEAAAELNIQFLTLYVFSTENWERPKTEINALMTLLLSTLHSETKALNENNIRLLVIGDLKNLPKKVNNELQKTISKTAKNTGLTAVLALSYSARWEIINTVKTIGNLMKQGKISEDEINDELFNKYLTTNNVPYPELLIRTSGEYRISNFLLWQIAYTELYFTDKLWPDFRKEDFYKAIYDFQNRERRYGKISEQISRQ